VVAFANPATWQLCTLIKTVLSNDLQMKILALDTDLDGSKFNTARPTAYLKDSERQMQDNDTDTLMMYVDAYDSFFQGGPKEILDSFNKLGHAVLYGGI
jgi:hypothetical protein